VEPGFPYISAAGNQVPESCFFGQMLNICAALSEWQKLNFSKINIPRSKILQLI